MTEPITWRKSSYSLPEGQNCVEIADLWRKSSYSSAKGENCVEIADLPAPSTGVRDSKHPGLGHLAFGRGEWAAFLAGVKRGASAH
ncbi:hypothetical protein HDA32_000777 [Spinactinospora alkalitolerans]|uniref:DUF397 domain-containing protein n=1 Tax=Spinactinospora alkalitolerans TaxID=687207 RepID=A0A852TQT6_9ACTN|nr:DUF397 domain-containing protein [Spinactinospora alkalitolerans]NYE45657.1 hypothetical protein [Spinactinospora alkalitolerans]